MDNKISLSEKVFSKRGYKFLLFLGLYIFVAEVFYVLAWFIYRFDFNWAILILSPAGFPFGFGWPVFSYQLLPPEMGFVIGWLSYLSITVYSVVTKNSRTAKILYLIFVLLLILNMIGDVVGMALFTSGAF